MKKVQDNPLALRSLVDQYLLKSVGKHGFGHAHSSAADIFPCPAEGENVRSLNTCLNWLKDRIMNAKDTRMKQMLELATLNQPDVFPDVKINNNAMIRACEKNNFQMVKDFLRHGFQITTVLRYLFNSLAQPSQAHAFPQRG